MILKLVVFNKIGMVLIREKTVKVRNFDYLDCAVGCETGSEVRTKGK